MFHGEEAMLYTIKPSTLTLNGKPLITNAALSLLETNSITLNLNYFDSDPSNLDDKPVLLFIHGNYCSLKAFENLINSFSSTYRVVAIDLLGHGQSSKIYDLKVLTVDEKDCLSQNFYNPCSIIAQISQLLKAKNILDAHAIGWGVGGCLVFGLAMEYPEVVGSIITISSPPVKFGMEGFKKGFSEAFTNTLIPQWQSANKKYSQSEAETLAERLGFSSNDKVIVNDIMESDHLMRKFFFLDPDQYQSVKVLDSEEFSKNTNIPLCFLIAEGNYSINKEYISNFGKHFKNEHSCIKLVKNSKNAIFKTNNAECAQLISSFVEEQLANKNKLTV